MLILKIIAKNEYLIPIKKDIINFIENKDNGCYFINETCGTAAWLILLFLVHIFLISTNFNKFKFDSFSPYLKIKHVNQKFLLMFAQ